MSDQPDTNAVEIRLASLNADLRYHVSRVLGAERNGRRPWAHNVNEIERIKTLIAELKRGQL